MFFSVYAHALPEPDARPLQCCTLPPPHPLATDAPHSLFLRPMLPSAEPMISNSTDHDGSSIRILCSGPQEQPSDPSKIGRSLQPACSAHRSEGAGTRSFMHALPLPSLQPCRCSRRDSFPLPTKAEPMYRGEPSYPQLEDVYPPLCRHLCYVKQKKRLLPMRDASEP